MENKEKEIEKVEEEVLEDVQEEYIEELTETEVLIKEVKELIKFGSNRIAASLLGDIYSRVDQLAIGSLLGPTALGIYSIAFNFSMQPFLKINPVLTQMSFPLFSIIKN